MTLPSEMKAEQLVPAREDLEKALKVNHEDGVQLRRLMKMRDDLDELAGKKPPREKRKRAPEGQEEAVA